MIYVLADRWFGRNAALFAGLIFLFSPLAWFHGTVALTYIVEAFFSALTGYLCWRIYCGAARFILPGAMVVGMAAGFRPSSLLLLGPLLLFSFRNANRKQAAAGIGALALTLLAWFIPMIRIGGGTALPLIACVAVAGRAVEGDGFQFLRVGTLWPAPRRSWASIFSVSVAPRYSPSGRGPGIPPPAGARPYSRWSG